MAATAVETATTDSARRTRAAILDVVVELIDTVGDEGFVVREVAKAAHVSLTTLYNFFPTRDALIVGALAHWHQHHGLADAVPPPTDATTRDSLRSLLRQTYEPWERHPNIFKAYVRFLYVPDGAILRAQITGALQPITFSPEAMEVKAVLADVAYAASARYAAGMIAITDLRAYLERVVELLTSG